MPFDDILITDKQGASLLLCSVPTFWRRVKDGTIPKPLKIGRTSRWLRSDILAVIERAAAEREAA